MEKRLSDLWFHECLRVAFSIEISATKNEKTFNNIRWMVRIPLFLCAFFCRPFGPLNWTYCGPLFRKWLAQKCLQFSDRKANSENAFASSSHFGSHFNSITIIIIIISLFEFDKEKRIVADTVTTTMHFQWSSALFLISATLPSTHDVCYTIRILNVGDDGAHDRPCCARISV